MRFFAVIMSVIAAITTLGAPDPAIVRFESEVDSIFRAVYPQDDIPGATVMILKDGEPVVGRCYGLANLEKRIPVTLNTNFCIASVSKQFAAVALLQLVQQGKIALSDPLSKFFPEYKAPFFSRITIHHILSHTSGLPDARPRTDRNFVLYATDVESVEYMKTLDYLNFEPGERYEYQNPTYELIYQIIPRVTGIDFEKYMRRNVFGLAGMRNTRYFEPNRIINEMATGYRYNDATGRYEECDYGEETFFATKADGALYTSIADFVKWERALKQLKVWDAQSRSLAYSPKVMLSADANYGYQPYTGYGYGFFIQEAPGRSAIVYHTGDNGGFTIYAGKVPEHDVVFLFFSTRDDIDRMSIVNAVYDKMEPLGWLLPAE